MKKVLSLFLALSICVTLLNACGSTTNETLPTETDPTPAWTAGPEALQNKKIIFIGNSYTYWGQTVIYKGSTILGQEERSNDHGYFYQLCKANGLDVSVTNWTFGGHDITAMFDGPCDKSDSGCEGMVHDYYLTDRYFDYVCIQPYREQAYQGDIIKHLEYTMNLFRDANPNVCFLLLVPQMAAERNYSWFKDIEALESQNVKICNWGGMLHDITQGNIQVPGATQPYIRTTFVNTLDNHHENLLAGYITTLFVYCAITGESAVGQPYDFCDNNELNPLFDLEIFRAKNYPAISSNFVEVFRSEADMKGLQQLVDAYLAE